MSTAPSFIIPGVFEAQPVTQERIVEVIEDVPGEQVQDVQEVVEKDVEVVMYALVPEKRKKVVPIKVKGDPIEIPRYVDKKVSCIAKVYVYEDEVTVRELPSVIDLPKVDERVEVVQKQTVQILYIPEDIDVDVPIYEDIISDRVEPVDIAMTIECEVNAEGKWVAPIPFVTEAVREEKITQPIEMPTPIDRDVPAMGLPRKRELVRGIPIEEEVETVKIKVIKNQYVDSQRREILQRDANGNPIVDGKVVPKKIIPVEVLDVKVKENVVEKYKRHPEGTQVQPIVYPDGTVANMRDALVSTTAGLIPFAVFYKHMQDAENAPPAIIPPAIPPHPDVLKAALEKGYIGEGKRGCF